MTYISFDDLKANYWYFWTIGDAMRFRDAFYPSASVVFVLTGPDEIVYVLLKSGKYITRDEEAENG